VVVAGALCFQRGNHLYGRYWGCLPEWGGLHFELCYHAPIEACIEQGWTHFEAGAQGMHKMQRGLVPVRTWSAHHLRHSGLHDAVQRATSEEKAHIASEIEWLTERGPFHRTKDQAG
jgi:predicted N-acyltransferase